MTTIPALDDDRVLRHVELEGTGYTLLTWDTGRTTGRGSFAKDAIGYAFYEPGKDEPLFVGEDFGNSPMDAIDSDESLRALLGFLTLRPGDTDPEYFESYTPEQMDFARSEAEQLQMWGMEDEPSYEFTNLDDRDEYEENAGPPTFVPRFSRSAYGGGEEGERKAHTVLLAHEAAMTPGTSVRVYGGRLSGMTGVVLGVGPGRTTKVQDDDGLEWTIETRNLELVPNPTDMTVANTILEQMGGRRMAMMIGAHSFVGSKNSVSFRWKARGKDGINAIRIVLDPSDTYTVEFYSLRGMKRTPKYETSDVYAEALQPLFESKTGLALRL